MESDDSDCIKMRNFQWTLIYLGGIENANHRTVDIYDTFIQQKTCDQNV